MLTHIYAHTYIYPSIHIYIHTYTHTCAYAYLYTYMHTCTHIRACIFVFLCPYTYMCSHICRLASHALANLSVNADNQRLMADNGAIESLIPLLQTKHELIQRQAAKALANLGVNPENKRKIAIAGDHIFSSSLRYRYSGKKNIHLNK